MYQKENSSWVKHADFTICDMLCLQLDIEILVKTVMVVFRGSGAK